jgi:HEAT repeat protein
MLAIIILIPSTVSAADIRAEITRLRGKDSNEAIAAARVLAQVRTPEAVAAMAGRLKSEKDSYTKRQLIEALTLEHSTSALEAILSMVNDPDPQVRQTTMINLGYFGDEKKIVPVIEQRMKSEANEAVSLSAVSAISVFRSTGAVTRSIP